VDGGACGGTLPALLTAGSGNPAPLVPGRERDTQPAGRRRSSGIL